MGLVVRILGQPCRRRQAFIGGSLFTGAKAQIGFVRWVNASHS